jgi:hypothetical protein
LADVDVAALIAQRFYGFGEAPEKVEKPYAVWQMVGGFPENKLAGIPDEDSFTTQIDAYATKEETARLIAEAIRDALEPHGYVTSYNFEGRDPDTRLCRYSLTMEFMMPRENGS